MRQRPPGDGLRVVIAGNIFAKRALVRRFLEDDGFDVVGEAQTREQLLSMGGLSSADGLVVDDLNRLRDALASGRPIEASWIVAALQTHLPEADHEGFSISGLGTRLLHPFIGDLAPSLLGDLASLFGSVLDVATGSAQADGGASTGGTSGSTSGIPAGTAETTATAVGRQRPTAPAAVGRPRPTAPAATRRRVARV